MQLSLLQLNALKPLKILKDGKNEGLDYIDTSCVC